MKRRGNTKVYCRATLLTRAGVAFGRRVGQGNQAAAEQEQAQRQIKDNHTLSNFKMVKRSEDCNAQGLGWLQEIFQEQCQKRK